MIIPHFLLSGAEAAQYVGQGKKLVNQMAKAGIRSKTLQGPNGVSIRAEQFGNTGKVFVNAPKRETDVEERTKEITQCGVWIEAASGGYGTTVDVWDMSTLPVGTVMDVRYNMLSQPDKLIMEYKKSVVLNTGWRGSVSYANTPPFNVDGIAGPGVGQVLGVFTKTDSDVFKTTVIGGMPGTAWAYALRANCPNS